MRVIRLRCILARLHTMAKANCSGGGDRRDRLSAAEVAAGMAPPG